MQYRVRRVLSEATVRQFVRSLGPGQQIQLGVSGISMWPLLLPGDQVRLIRCDRSALRLGDVAVVEIGGKLVLHIVTRTAPLQTSSIVGVRDREGEVLGRMVEVKRGAHRWPYPRGLRLGLWLVPHLAPYLTRVPGLRGLVRLVRSRTA